MFPVCDMQGRVLGFGARKLGAARGPKYVNSPSDHKGELLYGAHHARTAAAKAGAVIVVEGYIDALAMHQAGLDNTVALMGTAVTEYQIALLKRLTPTAVLMLDGDDSGAKAVLRAGELARTAGLEILVASLPAGSDPAALLQRHGADVVRARVGAAGAFACFQVRQHVQRADLSSAEGKDRLVGELRSVFADIPSSAVREDLIELVAQHLALPPSLVASWLPTPEIASTCAPRSLVEGARAPAEHGRAGRGLLMRCVADPEAAMALPSESALAALFPDELSHRAAAHIRAHPADPAAALSPEDHALVAYITGLLTTDRDA